MDWMGQAGIACASCPTRTPIDIAKSTILARSMHAPTNERSYPSILCFSSFRCHFISHVPYNQHHAVTTATATLASSSPSSRSSTPAFSDAAVATEASTSSLFPANEAEEEAA